MGWDNEQVANARTIAQVGRQLGASSRDIQIALMAAIVESGLHNLSYGDRDSVGLFQQRSAWGSFQQRTNPADAARMFFTGGHGGQRGLLNFSDRNHMGMGQAAQAVQVSAFPDRYAQHAGDAAGLLNTIGLGKVKGTLGAIPDITALTDTTTQQATTGTQLPTEQPALTVDPVGAVSATSTGLGESSMGLAPRALSDEIGSLNPTIVSGPTFDPMAELHMPTAADVGLGNPDPQSTTTTTTFPGGKGGGATEGWRKAVVAMAHKFLGTPYVWGATGPSAFDCSGLVQYIYNRNGFNLPRVSMDQARSGHRVALSDLKPGDLVAWDNSSRNAGADHIAVFIGNGQIIEAPHPGANVQVSNLYDTSQAWGVRLGK